MPRRLPKGRAWRLAAPTRSAAGSPPIRRHLRTSEPLTDKERKIHDEGLISILKQIHDDLDAAVLEAYRWEDLVGRGGPAAPTCPPQAKVDSGPGRSALPVSEALEQELLTRLVALNHERAAEEILETLRSLGKLE